MIYFLFTFRYFCFYNTNSSSHFSHFSSINTPYFSASSPTEICAEVQDDEEDEEDDEKKNESGDHASNENEDKNNKIQLSPEAGENQQSSDNKKENEETIENSTIPTETTTSTETPANNNSSTSISPDSPKLPEKSPSPPPQPDPLQHINTLFSFLKSKEINPLLASYFSRTLAELLQRKPEKIWSYIRDNQGQEFFQNVVRHINTSAIWDLLMRLMTCKEGRTKTEILTWLNTHGLIKSLIENLKPDKGSLKNHAASLALTDIVRLSRERSEFGFGNPLLDELEQESTINAILDTILEADQLAQGKGKLK